MITKQVTHTVTLTAYVHDIPALAALPEACKAICPEEGLTLACGNTLRDFAGDVVAKVPEWGEWSAIPVREVHDHRHHVSCVARMTRRGTPYRLAIEITITRY